MSVSARFYVQQITKHPVNNGEIARNVKLSPVVRATGLPGAAGNVDWAKYTPSGSIELNVNAEAAGQWFEEHLGKDVAITFASVPEGE